MLENYSNLGEGEEDSSSPKCYSKFQIKNLNVGFGEKVFSFIKM